MLSNLLKFTQLVSGSIGISTRQSGSRGEVFPPIRVHLSPDFHVHTPNHHILY